MDFVKIKETCLYVRELERTRSFYEGKLGFAVIGEVQGRHVFFRVGSSVLLCFIAEAAKAAKLLPPHHGQGQLHVAFETEPENYEAWKQKIKKAEIPIEQEYEWGRGFCSFYFRDPDAHLLEVVMTGMWEK